MKRARREDPEWDDDPHATRETSWLIEANWPEHNRPPTPQWWHPKHGWTWDADRALRFAREIDAADYVASQAFLSGKATEHVFLGQSLSGNGQQVSVHGESE